jgi:hypothetical protein
MSWSWQGARDFLSGGRKKYERPLYDRSLRIWKENKWDADSPISIGWKYSGNVNKFVTYHKDGTTVIEGGVQNSNWGSTWNVLRSQSVRLTIHRYAGISVSQRNFKFYLQEDDAPLSPPKIQGCRQCKQTGLVDSWCSPTYCWGLQTIQNKAVCLTHPDTEIDNISARYGRHMIPCPHNQDMGHTVPRGQTCYACNGTRKRDYGSKPERTQWDGTPIRLRDGKIIKSAASLLERMVADYVEPIG